MAILKGYTAILFQEEMTCNYYNSVPLLALRTLPHWLRCMMPAGKQTA